jgi:tRNA 2-thiouridine synthesizing protein C
VPCLSDLLFAYPEVRILAHEPSLFDRGLMNQSLMERVELADEDVFMNEIRAADCVITL